MEEAQIVGIWFLILAAGIFLDIWRTHRREQIQELQQHIARLRTDKRNLKAELDNYKAELGFANEYLTRLHNDLKRLQEAPIYGDDR